MTEVLTCASESRALNEPLAGTVKPTDIYFLIETNVTEYGGWSNEITKKIAKTGNFAPYMQHLSSVSRSKVLLIRQPQANEMNFYIAITNQAQPKIYHAMLSSYDDLLNVEIDSVAPDAVPTISGQAMTEVDELYAVCTNGKHDPCCSTHGIPVYHAMVEHAGADKVWQVSHIGGHRMAATMLAFPQGIGYGHLDAFNAEEVVTNHRAGYLLTHKYRGRGAYGDAAMDTNTHLAVGAAEYHIRESAKKYKIDDLIFASADALGDMEWQVKFTDNHDIVHQVEVQTSMSEPRLSSCSDDKKPMPVHSVKVVSY